MAVRRSQYERLDKEDLVSKCCEKDKEIEELMERVAKLETKNKEMMKLSQIGIKIPTLAELENTLDEFGFPERKEYLCMPPSQELSEVTDRSIPDLFINLGLSTCHLTTFIEERRWVALTSGFHNFRRLVHKEVFAKNMKEYNLEMEEASLRTLCFHLAPLWNVLGDDPPFPLAKSPSHSLR